MDWEDSALFTSSVLSLTADICKLCTEI